MILLLQILKHFLLLLQLLILRLLVTLLLNFIPIVRVYLRGLILLQFIADTL